MPLDGSGDKFYGTYACARARASAPSRTRSFEQELARAREANALSITKCPSLPPSARTRLKSTQSGSFIYDQITINQETRKTQKTHTHSLSPSLSFRHRRYCALRTPDEKQGSIGCWRMWPPRRKKRENRSARISENKNTSRCRETSLPYKTSA